MPESLATLRSFQTPALSQGTGTFELVEQPLAHLVAKHSQGTCWKPELAEFRQSTQD
jgi:hypothetical protein